MIRWNDKYSIQRRKNEWEERKNSYKLLLLLFGIKCEIYVLCMFGIFWMAWINANHHFKNARKEEEKSYIFSLHIFARAQYIKTP